jgi:hypothetical protein
VYVDRGPGLLRADFTELAQNELDWNEVLASDYIERVPAALERY